MIAPAAIASSTASTSRLNGGVERMHLDVEVLGHALGLAHEQHPVGLGLIKPELHVGPGQHAAARSTGSSTPAMALRKR